LPHGAAIRRSSDRMAECRRVGDRRLHAVPPDLARHCGGLGYRCVAPGAGAMTAPALQLSNICKRFGAAEIIRGVSLSVMMGERHAVIGSNGAGKSTLFNLISGRMRPDFGSVTLKGADITGMKPWLINRRGLSRSFQVTNIFHRMSVWENVRAAVLWSARERDAFLRDASRAR